MRNDLPHFWSDWRGVQGNLQLVIIPVALSLILIYAELRADIIDGYDLGILIDGLLLYVLLYISRIGAQNVPSLVF